MSEVVVQAKALRQVYKIKRGMFRDPAQLQAVSSFISATGPVREARFPRAVAASGNADEVSAGAVANLFVIQGRPDAPAGCAIDQEPFAAQVAAHNVVFRIPIPLFGEGFVENTTDTSATFTGQDGHTYTFFSIATDNSDNVLAPL